MSKNEIKSDTIGASCVQLVGKHAQGTSLMTSDFRVVRGVQNSPKKLDVIGQGRVRDLNRDDCIEEFIKRI